MKTKIFFIIILLILWIFNVSFIFFEKKEFYINDNKLTTKLNYDSNITNDEITEKENLSANEIFLIKLKEKLPKVFILLVDHEYISTCGTSSIDKLTEEEIMKITHKSKLFMDLFEIQNNFNNKVYDNYVFTLKELSCS